MLQAAHIGLAGIGLCDRNSVAGVVRAHLIKREKQLPLAYHPGARLVFADGTPDILAYPRDRPAWGRLCRLLTRGNLRAEKGDCILYRNDLLEHVEGLELIVMETSTRDFPPAPLLRDPQGHEPFLGETRERQMPGQSCGWWQARRKIQARMKSACSRFCARPPAAACGSRQACSIAATTARD